MADTTRTQLTAGTGSAAAQPATALLRLVGVSLVETAGSTAVVSFQESASTDLTKELLVVSLAANEAKTVWLPEHGLLCEGGIWVNRVSGTTRVNVYSRVSDTGKDSKLAPYY